MVTARAATAQLQAAGLTQRAIARELDLAPPTVTDHLGRLAREDPRVRARESAIVEPTARTSRTREAVAGLLAQGVSRAEIARRLQISTATASYHARRTSMTSNFAGRNGRAGRGGA